MAVDDMAAALAALEAKIGTGTGGIADVVKLVRGLQSGATLKRVLTVGGGVPVAWEDDIGQGWQIIVPWTASTPGAGGGYGVTPSVDAGTLTIEDGGAGRYLCHVDLSGTTDGPIQVMLRVTRPGDPDDIVTDIQGDFETEAGRIRFSFDVDGEVDDTPTRFETGDVVALYARRGSAGTTHISVYSGAAILDRKLAA